MNVKYLKKIFNKYPKCITNGKKFKKVLFAVFPNTSKIILNTLVAIINAGIGIEVQAYNQISAATKVYDQITALDKERWRAKIHNKYGIEENIVDICLSILFSAFEITALSAGEAQIVDYPKRYRRFKAMEVNETIESSRIELKSTELEIIDEICDFSDLIVRSDEDGWFYDDEDELEFYGFHETDGHDDALYSFQSLNEDNPSDEEINF